MKKYFVAAVVLYGAISLGMATGTNVLFEEKFDGAGTSEYRLEGDAEVFDFGRTEWESSGKAARLNAAQDGNRDGQRAGAVRFVAKGLEGSEGKWFRFSCRGLPGKGFRVKEDADLAIRIHYYSKSGAPLDGVVKEIYGDVVKNRADIGRNGDGFRDGAVAWPEYVFDFRLPFNEIDTADIAVEFRNGEGVAPYGSFFVDDAKLERIDISPTASDAASVMAGAALREEDLTPIGGRWYYLAPQGERERPAPTHYDSANLQRLVYRTGSILETPFAQVRGAWLRKGFKDARGQIMQRDAWMDNVVEVDFQPGFMVMHSRDIPNHPSGIFPGYLRNPNYIQEQDLTYYLPLEPQPNPSAIAMTYRNANRALPMGPTGVAINGVVFYNPFDAGMEEAVGIMDRCCGHPNQDNQYHYHKYPVCARSPFEDTGREHSHLIGWAFDGFPVYGPYEAKGEMAMNSKTNPLNAFNMHYDTDRGWHYHVTPGKFPYIIGGYWGLADRRNFGPPRHPMRK